MWMVPLAVAPPLFSTDVYSYLSQAEVVSRGFDPYVYGAAQALGLSDPLVASIPTIWRDTPSPYGPGFLTLGRVITGDRRRRHRARRLPAPRARAGRARPRHLGGAAPGPPRGRRADRRAVARRSARWCCSTWSAASTTTRSCSASSSPGLEIGLRRLVGARRAAHRARRLGEDPRGARAGLPRRARAPTSAAGGFGRLVRYGAACSALGLGTVAAVLGGQRARVRLDPGALGAEPPAQLAVGDHRPRRARRLARRGPRPRRPHRRRPRPHPRRRARRRRAGLRAAAVHGAARPAGRRRRHGLRLRRGLPAGPVLHPWYLLWAIVPLAASVREPAHPRLRRRASARRRAARAPDRRRLLFRDLPAADGHHRGRPARAGPAGGDAWTRAARPRPPRLSAVSGSRRPRSRCAASSCATGRAAVDGLDLDLAPGSVLALLGPNGAGKTTTVEVCEGLRSPRRGRGPGARRRPRRRAGRPARPHRRHAAGRRRLPRRARPRDARPGRRLRRRTRSTPTGSSTSSGSPAAPARPTSGSRSASSSASRWRAPSSGAPSWCSSTSPPRAWTRRAGASCGSSCAPCAPTASRCCSPRT